MVVQKAKVVLKFTTTKNGELFVMICLTTQMQQWYVDNSVIPPELLILDPIMARGRDRFG